jgi:hypothetical protein
MAEQVGRATASGVVAGAGGMGTSSGGEPAPFVSQVAGTPVHFPHFSGRPVSWVAVTMILVGFLTGGLALIFGPTWWLFWVACGVAVVGALMGLATGIFDDWY